MYLEFFNFTEAPFTIAPDPHFIFMSTRHQEGLAHLLYGINEGGGFVALTGEVGTGKTTLCQCLLRQLPEAVDIALILNPKMNATELLATICDELSVPYDDNRQTLKILVDSLNYYLLDAHGRGRRTVVMIDEAQNLSFAVLEQIRLLTNLETSKSKLLQIILVGQPELQDLLASPQLRQLNQRITARFHLLPLNRIETGLYIRNRLGISHGEADIFTDMAIRRIHRLSGGVPRLINILCDRALLGAYVHHTRKVTGAIVNQAAKEVDGHLLARDKKLRRVFLLSGLMLSIAVATYVYFPASLIEKSAGNKPRIPVSGSVKAGDEPSRKKAQQSPQQPIIPGFLEQGSVAKGRGSISEPVTLLPAPDPVPVPEEPAPGFEHYIEQPDLSLQQAYDGLLRYWHLPPASLDECTKLAVSCLAEKTDWPGLLSLNRPVVLEFQINESDKRFLLMTGLKAGKAVFRDRDQDVEFAEQAVRKYWKGNFLLFWEPPYRKVEILYPGQISKAVAWLREKLYSIQGGAQGKVPPGFYDDGLKNRVGQFQLAHNLPPDGIAGPLTFIHLQNELGSYFGPRLNIID